MDSLEAVKNGRCWWAAVPAGTGNRVFSLVLLALSTSDKCNALSGERRCSRKKQKCTTSSYFTTL